LTVGGPSQRPLRHELIEHDATGVHSKTKQAHCLMQVERKAGHLAKRFDNCRDDVGMGTFRVRCAIVNVESVGIRAQPLSNASVPPPHANTFTQLARPPERREDAKRYQPSVIGRAAPYLIGGVSSSRRQSVLGQVFDDIAQALVGLTQVIDHPLGVSNHGSRDRRVA
jgi:hypothetical protein